LRVGAGACETEVRLAGDPVAVHATSRSDTSTESELLARGKALRVTRMSRIIVGVEVDFNLWVPDKTYMRWSLTAAPPRGESGGCWRPSDMPAPAFSDIRHGWRNGTAMAEAPDCSNFAMANARSIRTTIC
jgi:hypothetical protein